MIKPWVTELWLVARAVFYILVLARPGLRAEKSDEYCAIVKWVHGERKVLFKVDQFVMDAIIGSGCLRFIRVNNGVRVYELN